MKNLKRMAAGWKVFTGSSQYPELTSNSTGSAFIYGSKRDRNFRMAWLQGKRDSTEEARVIDWLNHVTSERVAHDADHAMDQLQDGKILCKLLLRLNPRALLRPVNQKPPLFSATDNVANFVDSLQQQLGFQKDEVFPVNVLVEKKDLSPVIATLLILKQKVTSS